MDNNPIQNQDTPTSPATVFVPPKTDGTSKGGRNFELNRTTFIASLSYVGPLVIVPFLTERGNPFVMFHIKQGLVVLILSLIIWVTSGYLGFLGPILQLINFGLWILSIIGIVYALQSKEQELPLVGSFAHQIKL